jgi:hypothetical protein
MTKRKPLRFGERELAAGDLNSNEVRRRLLAVARELNATPATDVERLAQLGKRLSRLVRLYDRACKVLLPSAYNRAC